MIFARFCHFFRKQGAYHVEDTVGHFIHFAPPPDSLKRRRRYRKKPNHARLAQNRSKSGFQCQALPPGGCLDWDLPMTPRLPLMKLRKRRDQNRLHSKRLSIFLSQTLLTSSLTLWRSIWFMLKELLDTIAFAWNDPFDLAPLTPGVTLNDTTMDTHRELWDALLLFQISTFDFARASLEPMAPQRMEMAARGFFDARNDSKDTMSSTTSRTSSMPPP